jgi:dipeptidyl-peptidase 4
MLLITCAAAINVKAQQQQLTIDDIWYSGKFYGNPVNDFQPMKDGLHYTVIEEGEAKTVAIVEYDYQNGKAVDTLLKNTWLKTNDKKPAYFKSYTLSNDESKILIPINTESIYRRSSRSTYLVYDIKTKTTTNLSPNAKQENAVFSPDGSKAAFVRDNNIFIEDIATAKETQVTTDGKRNFIINGLTDWVYEEEFEFTQAFAWSPDGKRIAFYRFDETHVPEYTLQYFNDSTYPENYTYKYPKAGETNAKVSISIYDVATGKTILADIGKDTDQYIPRMKWTKDANVLSLQRMNRHQNKLEILLVNANDGSTKTILTETSKTYINVTNDLTFFNNNQNFIWTSEEDGFKHIYNYTIDGKPVNKITTGNWDVSAFYGVDEKNKTVFYQSAEVTPMQRYVYSISLDGKDKKQLTEMKGINGADFTPTYSYFLNTHSDANTPDDYSIYDSKGKQIRVVEDNADLKGGLKLYALSPKKFFSFKTPGGVQLNGWMIKPVNFDSTKTYPVYMTVYGGPGAQMVMDQWENLNYMSDEFIAEHGYIVVCVDNRGTGGRGFDFENCTYLHLGKLETLDQISAAEYLQTLPYVDKNRIGIFGWSYGGFMACNCIEQGSDVFKMAIAVAPVTDWRFYDSIYTERYMLTPKENPEGYKETSDLEYADRIKGKFLLVHGLDDDNVHFQNSAELMKKMQEANVVFQSIVFPGKNHGIYGGNTRAYLYKRLTDFIFTNL